MDRTLVLASASPRRRELLARLGLPFVVRPAGVDETRRPGEAAVAYVERLARAKASSVAGAVVLGADTAVEIDGNVLGKPHDDDEARVMLRRLSGRGHVVHTAVAVRRDGDTSCVVTSTVVRFADLGDADIDHYVATGEPADKAGAYGMQGVGGVFVEAVEGSWSGVIGVPLAETVVLLRAAGVAVLGGSGDVSAG